MTVREIVSTNGRRKLVVSVENFTGANGRTFRSIKVANYYRAPDADDWRRLGFAEIRPQDVDELLAAISVAYDALVEGRAA